MPCTKHELLVLWEHHHFALSREQRALFLARKEITAICMFDRENVEKEITKERMLSKVLVSLILFDADGWQTVVDDYYKELEFAQEEQDVDWDVMSAEIARDVIAAGEHPFMQRTDQYGFTDNMDDEDLADTEESGFSISDMEGRDEYSG
jgi:hypothetical protein